MRHRYLLGAALLALLQSGPALAQYPSDPEQPGSFLVFQKFDWRPGNSTQLRITNINDEYDVGVKLNYVCPGVYLGDQRCKALDRTIVLTPHETRVIDVAEHRPPCKKGAVFAWALYVDKYGRTGCPIAFNNLIGSWHITKGKKLESENAIAFQAAEQKEPLPVNGNTVVSCLGSGTPLGLYFGGEGADYQGSGSELFTDFLAVDAAACKSSALTLLTLDTLAGRQNPSTSVYIDFWNSVEVPFSTSHEFVCWDESDLDAIDVNFEAASLGTSYGSMTIGAIPNCPLPGGCPPLQEYDPTLLGAITETTLNGSSVRNLLSDDYEKQTTYVPR